MQSTGEEELFSPAGRMEPKEAPGCLYEHMVQRVAPYSCAGFLWYQGENDDVPGFQSLSSSDAARIL